MTLQQPKTGKAALADFLIDQSADLVISPDDYAWPWERARWYELVFCLLQEATGSQSERGSLRELVACLAGLNLLEVDRLAADGADDAGPMLERLIVGYGIAPAEASQAVRAILDAAASVRNRFDGHIQRYLRLYGERMLAEIGSHFQFSAMDDDAVARVFTRWLQNAAAMPLSQMGGPVKTLARSFDSTPEAARDAADEVGIGLALFDDIVLASHPEDDGADG